MIKTPLCDLLGIEYPIFQGGMAWISDGKLAAAVSNGGGLGIISAMNADAEYLKKQIDLARSLTDKPFGVNIMLMSPFAEEVAKLVTKAGAAAVIAEGGESGGHVGDLTTMVLVPQVCDATDLPVLAAGGIGDGRGVAAAFLLGAVGVQVGTRFLVAEECGVHPNYKKKVLKANDIATMVTGKRLGHPVRQIKNQFAKEYAKAEYSSISDEELEKLGGGALYRAAVEGDEKTGDFLAGQISGMIHKEQPAAEIIREMFEGAEEVLKGAGKWVK